jgi:hypothetical protein
MKAPFKAAAPFTFTAPDAAAADRLALVVPLEKPIEQGGEKFRFLVAPFSRITETTFLQVGPGVLCQTKAEADETLAAMAESQRKHFDVFQLPTFGGIAIINNLRPFESWFDPFWLTSADGKKEWFAVERKRYTVTLEVVEIRRQQVPTEKAALALCKQWADEIEKQKKPASAPRPPPPPDRAERHWGPSDNAAVAAARMAALRREWPKFFAGIEATPRASNDALTDAYLIDVAEHSGNISTAFAIRQDPALIIELADALRRCGKRRVANANTSAVSLMAFNYLAGWCYLSDAAIADKLSAALGKKFTARQVEHFRLRDLGKLYSKHLPGPEPKRP